MHTCTQGFFGAEIFPWEKPFDDPYCIYYFTFTASDACMTWHVCRCPKSQDKTLTWHMKAIQFWHDNLGMTNCICYPVENEVKFSPYPEPKPQGRLSKENTRPVILPAATFLLFSDCQNKTKFITLTAINHTTSFIVGALWLFRWLALSAFYPHNSSNVVKNRIEDEYKIHCGLYDLAATTNHAIQHIVQR